MEHYFSKMKSVKALTRHYEKIKHLHMRDMFASDPNRFNRFSIKVGPMLFDYSKNRITKETMELLFGLAEEAGLRERIKAMFRGEKINITEDRSVLHVALRMPRETSLIVDGYDVVKDVHRVLDKMRDFVERVRNGQWRGYGGARIRHVINIGIGGSDLGPKMVVRALSLLNKGEIEVRFVSNIDPVHLFQSLEDISPEDTLFIISSKSFTTLETMENAKWAREWVLNHFKREDCIEKHFVAVSTNTDAVKDFGISPDNMFEFWDFVGGRYSLWSAIGLSIALSIGFEGFEQLLAGAHFMDEHFKNSHFFENVPVIMGLLTVWYVNFFGCSNYAILPYSQLLDLFPAHLQQLVMESNGKRVTSNGIYVDYSTSPVIWGRCGTDGQHSFFQLLHQGTRFIPCDFIGFVKSPCGEEEKHALFMSNYFAQTEALMKGRKEEEVMVELDSPSDKLKQLVPHRSFPGNRPSNSLLLDELNPYTLGFLIALYEHRTFVEGTLWNINPFDQWGVELGKRLAKGIINDLRKREEVSSHDSSTNGLINYFKKV